MPQKIIYIIRHAKAEQSLIKKDFDRVLIDKGIERAQRIAHDFALSFQSDHTTLCITSPAHRAFETAEIFIKSIKYPQLGLVTDDRLYEASYLDILKVINQIPEQVHTIILFGHNPGLTDFIEYVSNKSIQLKTSQVVQLALDENISFDTLSYNSATLSGTLD